ncbi:nitroreductase family protein [Fusibacter sp. JL216-2]|uniref:nitroreductase family protein n=1 Tax=Fusibacter sp. JL216-2 TaxID=3071453 RepID=UPI003D339CAB
MFKVKKEDCIGCGLCVRDCFVQDIELVENCAVIKNSRCIKCGHCIAVCPKRAVLTDDYEMDQVKEYQSEDFDIEANKLLNFIKFRRTVRQFEKKTVEEEKIRSIIEAGRYTQTAGNRQDVSFIVVQESIPELKTLTLERLNNIGIHLLNNITDDNRQYVPYAKLWRKMYQDSLTDNAMDRLFFDAPVIIVVASKTELNGAIASTNMELMANALELGVCYNGFFTRAAKDNEEINKLLNLQEGSEVVTAMCVGYPTVKYLRTVPRKESEITWI